jgi:hypothetical protein
MASEFTSGAPQTNTITSPQLHFDKAAYLGIERYSKGFPSSYSPMLSICQNEKRDKDCLWQSPPGALPDGAWHEELVQLPPGDYNVRVYTVIIS